MSNIGRFDPVVFTQNDKEYRVEPDRVWGLIKTIEEHITFQEMLEFVQRDAFPELRVSEAYEAALKYAGCYDTTAMELQMDSTSAERAGHGWALFSVLLIAQPDIKKKMQAAVPSKKKDSQKAKQPDTSED